MTLAEKLMLLIPSSSHLPHPHFCRCCFFLGHFSSDSTNTTQFSVPTGATIAFGLCLLDAPLRPAGRAWECDLGLLILPPRTLKLDGKKGSSQETKANLTLEGLSALLFKCPV